jgi:uncharacterized membrane protein
MPRRSAGRSLSRVALAAAFVGAGAAHFLRPRMFEAIVPPALPEPRALVYASGAAEVAGGIGLLVPSLRRAAGRGLVALLFAVFPANVYMATEARRFRHLAPPWALWARLPLQFALVRWVRWASR